MNKFDTSKYNSLYSILHSKEWSDFYHKYDKHGLDSYLERLSYVFNGPTDIEIVVNINIPVKKVYLHIHFNMTIFKSYYFDVLNITEKDLKRLEIEKEMYRDDIEVLENLNIISLELNLLKYFRKRKIHKILS